MTAHIEVRELPVIGTHYKTFTLWLNGERIHAQLSPYSDSEIAERVARHKNPSAPVAFKVTDFRSKPGKKAKPYDWRDSPE